MKFPCTAFGTEALGYDDCETADTSQSIPNYIRRVYQFAIGISGILAVGMIVAGGIFYTVSAGKPDMQNEGKDMIFSALWGLALLFGAYIILNTINPRLTELREPDAPQFMGSSQLSHEKVWGWDETKKESCCVAVTQNGGVATCKDGGWGYDDASGKSCCLKGSVVGQCAYPSDDYKSATQTLWGWCKSEVKTVCKEAAAKTSNPSGISCCLAVEIKQTTTGKEEQEINLSGGLAQCKNGGWGWDDERGKPCCMQGYLIGECKYEKTKYTTGMQEAEEKTREKLALAGITVSSSGNCSDPFNRNCTNVGLLPESTINKIIDLKKKCGCEIVITGGAETGHATHGPDKPVFDLRTNKTLAEYLKNNNSDILKICTTKDYSQYAKNCDGYYEEAEHFHIHLK